MKAASIAVLKKELMKLEHGDLLEACLRLARFKKDNKELLTYLLFLMPRRTGFRQHACAKEINEQFSLTPNAHKKTLRKVIRWMNNVCDSQKSKTPKFRFGFTSAARCDQVRRPSEAPRS